MAEKGRGGEDRGRRGEGGSTQGMSFHLKGGSPLPQKFPVRIPSSLVLLVCLHSPSFLLFSAHEACHARVLYSDCGKSVSARPCLDRRSNVHGSCVDCLRS